ncbi:hypothetical protein [Spirillospora sp. NPDC047279]|uniref:hypothetical protein n=1 Tax=Spirillospora sp. NPDC047279 TaxID=3155478 RepID=UPI0033DA6FEC
MALVATGHGRSGTAAVRDAATGEPTAVIPLPPGGAEWLHVTRAGAPGTFYAAVRFEDLRIGVLRVEIGVDGEPRDLTPLPGERLGAFDPTCMAASPDGAQILLACTRAGGPELAHLLGTDGSRRGIGVGRTGEVTGVTWAEGGRVAFLWMPGTPHGATEVRVACLEPGGDLVPGSAVIATSLPRSNMVLDVVIGRDGGTFYLTTVEAEVTDGEPRWTRLLAFSGGPDPHVLFELRGPDPQGAPEMWQRTAMCGCGGELLAFASGSAYRIGLGGGWERLPFPEGRPYSAAW